MTSNTNALAAMLPDVYTKMSAAFALLSPQEQAVLKKGVAGDDTTGFDEAFNRFVQYTPVLASFETLANRDYKVKKACLLPFACWSLSQPWARNTPLETLDSYIRHWRKNQGVSFYQANDYRALFVIESSNAMLDIRMQMSGAKKNKCRTRFYQLAHQTYGLSGYGVDFARSIPPAMAQLGQLAFSCGTEDIQGTTPRRQWLEDVQRFCEKSTHANRVALLHALLDSNLDTSMTREVCNKMPAEVWLEKTIQAPIAQLLASDEIARLGQLPWTANADKNRALVSSYCPQMYPLMDIAVTSDAWSRQDQVTEQCSAYCRPTKTYALPDNMDLSL